MENFYFWDSEVWSFVNLVGLLFATMLVANMIKRNIPFMRKSLIPTSVLGGLLVFGVGAKMFYVAGPVIVNGVGYSIVVGLVYFLICLL